MNLEIVNPLQNPRWDDIVLGQRDYTIFHSVCWAKTLIEAYRYTPSYFVLKDGERLSAFLVCMEVNSILSGKRGVCLPFSDYCPPLFMDLRQLRDLFRRVFQLGRERGWNYIEWRGGESILDGQIPYQTYMGHKLILKGSKGELLEPTRDSTKRNIQKAVREGVQVRVLQSKEAVRAFYDLNCITRRDHGLPPQPKRFFKKVYEYLISGKNGYVLLAFYRDKPIAAGVFFHFGKKAIFKYGASAKAYHHLRANNLIMYEAMKLYAGQGYHTLDLGRTDREDTGLLQFKHGWGGVEYPIHYYRFNLEKEVFEKDIQASMRYQFLLKRLPLPLLRLVGHVFYRHMA